MTFDIARRLVMIGIGLSAAYALSKQCRRPTGWLGRRVARAMNTTHAGVTSWGLGHVTIDARARVLDIGCGGGQTIRRMALIATAGHVDGVDYSPASVETARKTNADLIQSGRVGVQQASVAHLPFADASFDLVTAVETHYYWPNLARDLREVRRVLAPGGRFLIIAETYKGRRMDWLFRPVMRLLLRATYLSLDEHRAAFVEAGFVDVLIDSNRRRGWMCAVGTRAELH
jgi:SAM-dependent methyltransferase